VFILPPIVLPLRVCRPACRCTFYAPVCRRSTRLRYHSCYDAMWSYR